MKAALKTNRLATLILIAFASITFMSSAKASPTGRLSGVSAYAYNLINIGKRMDLLMDKALSQTNLTARQYGDLEKFQSDMMDQAQLALVESIGAGQGDVIGEAQNTFALAQDLNNRINALKQAVRANPFNFGIYLIKALDVKNGAQNLIAAATNLYKASEKANG